MSEWNRVVPENWGGKETHIFCEAVPPNRVLALYQEIGIRKEGKVGGLHRRVFSYL